MENEEMTYDSIYKNNWYKVSDDFAVISISKNACSTVNIQSFCYQHKLDINKFKIAEYNHLDEVDLGYIFIENRVHLLREKPKGIKYVCIIRDPLERILSAFKTKDCNTNPNFDGFLFDVVKSFENEPAFIDQHILSQSNHFSFDDVDIFVYSSDYGKFCEKYNIPFIKLNQNPNKNYQSEIILTDKQKNTISLLYKDDYEMIEKIKQSGKLYGTL